MSEPYTPDSEDVEDYFALGLVEYAPGNGHVLGEAHIGFRRWLAEHDAQVRAEAYERTVAAMNVRIGLARREGAVEALRGFGDALDDVPGYSPSRYDEGRVDQRHDDAAAAYDRADRMEAEG